MKNFLLILLLLVGVSVQAQIQYGTWRTPSGNPDYHHFTRHGNGAAVYINQSATGSTYPIMRLSSGTESPNQNVKLTVENDGKVGIGTSTPNGLLEIVGPYTGNSQLIINTTQSNGELRFSDNGTAKGFVWYSQPSNHMAFGRGGTSTSMFVNPSGQFGFGTKSTGSHKLAVEGTIGAREIKVEATGWSDFVFENDYELRTLEDVEKHITENGHLPEIPSQQEVTENGIYLGEMNAKLLQKIEELTLYLIEQNKEIKEMRKEISALKNE